VPAGTEVIVDEVTGVVTDGLIVDFEAVPEPVGLSVSEESVPVEPPTGTPLLLEEGVDLCLLFDTPTPAPTATMMTRTNATAMMIRPFVVLQNGNGVYTT
jgi:hypothetical protein